MHTEFCLGYDIKQKSESRHDYPGHQGRPRYVERCGRLEVLTCHEDNLYAFRESFAKMARCTARLLQLFAAASRLGVRYEARSEGFGRFPSEKFDRTQKRTL